MVDTREGPEAISTSSRMHEQNLKPVIGRRVAVDLCREPSAANYDVIIVDAYCRPRIPIHRATEEAMAIYQDKLVAPQGAVGHNVLDRASGLESVVSAAAANDLKRWVYSEDCGATTNTSSRPPVVGSLGAWEADVGASPVDQMGATES